MGFTLFERAELVLTLLGWVVCGFRWAVLQAQPNGLYSDHHTIDLAGEGPLSSDRCMVSPCLSYTTPVLPLKVQTIALRDHGGG